MICPQCQTPNRDDRSECYHCGQELATLRMIVNRARNHYNEALEHAERGRDEEAIRELKHALELDGSFVEAWLVLGTLYARAERLDEAKQAWETAMGQDPRFERGHQYLLKAQRIEPSLPALKRLKLTALSLGGLLVLAAAFGVYQSLPDSGMRKIGEALDHREGGEWAAAMERLASAQSDPMASGKAKRTAEALRTEMSERLMSMLEVVRANVEARRYAEAVHGIGKLEALDPPSWAQQEVGGIKTRMGEAMAQAGEQEVVRYRAGEQSYEDLSGKLRPWIQLAGSSEGAAKLTALLEETGQEHRRTVMARLRPEILAIENDAKAAQRVDELAVQYPDLRTDLEDVLRSRLAVVAEARSNEFERLVGEGKLGEARERMLEFRALYEGLGRTAPADVTQRMEAALGRTEKSIALRELTAAFEARDYEAVLKTAPAVEAMNLSQAELAEVRARRGEAERLLGAELWNWSQERDQQFETLAVPLEDARRMVEGFELIIRHAPPAEATYRTTHSLFRAAAAYLRLGEAEEARQLVERLKRDFPESSVLRYPAFERFEARLKAESERG